MSDEISRKLFERAKRVIPGGVNSPVRAFRAVGGDPVFASEGRGSRLIGADGREYIDYVMSWGPLIFGHAHPPIVRAVCEAAARGTSFGAPTELEVRLAEAIVECVPSIERVRLTSSGTEATMSALRVARAFCRRDLVVKMDGCYHGHSDGLLVKAGSGGLTFGQPDSAGVPAAFAEKTLCVPYGDLAALERVLAERGKEIAAVILEPVAGNMGVVAPPPGYLASLCEATRRAGALVIFDEVISGFRMGLGGAQGVYGLRPDLTCLGKVIGGGLPVGAYGGRADVMAMVAPDGPAYQAGTLSGNPLAVTAGLVTIELLRAPGVYEALDRKGALLARAFDGKPMVVNRVGSLMTPFFTTAPVRDLGSAMRADTRRFARFHRAALERGVYLPPSQFEAMFVSLAHTDDDIARTAAILSEAADSALAS